MAKMAQTALMVTDFDLHGRVLLRLVNAPPPVCTAVTAETGLPPTHLPERTPGIIVDFVDDLPLAQPIRRIGRTAGFSGDLFLLGPASGRLTAIALDRLDDESIRLTCERGVVYIPHLVSLINLAMLRSGVLPLHASAVVVDGRGIVITGWSKGGKTEAVLGIMAAGGTFVADEWCYLDPGERRVLGLRHTIRVWDWQLRQFPALRRTLTAKQRARLTASGWLARAETFRGALEPTLGTYAAPEQLFAPDRLADRAGLDELVFVEAWDSPDIRTGAADPAQVAARMRASLRAERADLAADVEKFAHAFPDRPATTLDRAATDEAGLLDAAFAGLPTRVVSHPYPADLRALAREIVQRPGSGR